MKDENTNQGSTCIICRRNKTKFSVEHVIPDSINGSYIIHTVCRDCNSALGHKIDSKLTDHIFIKFKRFMLKIKGKSGSIPNPLQGTHYVKDNPSQKVRIEVDDDGNFSPKYLPIIPKLTSDLIDNNVHLSVDKKDEGEIDAILDKLFARCKLDRNKVNWTREIKEERPWIEGNLIVDLNDFKSALLKIAYEFAVDTIPAYFEDAEAIKISKLLHKADIKNIHKNITFYGNGFDDSILLPLKHMIDFDNNNHYLILLNYDFGLICFINLFNSISIGIKLSNKTDYIIDNVFIGINDFNLRTWKLYSLGELIDITYSPNELYFEYHFDCIAELLQFKLDENLDNFAFYKENDKVPFYSKHGKLLYTDVSNKLINLERKEIHDDIHSMIYEYSLDEDLYIKLLPTCKFYRVITVRIRRLLKQKI